jgi:hypothetical protein
MIGFITPYTFTTRDYRQYIASADLLVHTLKVHRDTHTKVSFFISRILATDL